MKIKYLGTAAAEGIPALFCACDNCRRARELGGKNVRSRAQALINSELLIDFSSDTASHAVSYGIDLSTLQHCLITHAHSDHLYVDNINMRRPMFSNIENRQPFHIYGSDIVVNKIKAEFEGEDVCQDNVSVLHALKAYESFRVLDYEIIPLPANHAADSGPFIYAIKQKDKSMLYANDTGVFFDEVFEFLKKSCLRFDMVSLDCTEGTRPVDYDTHMNIERNVKVRDTLFANGNADENTAFFVNHISHNGHRVLYDDMCMVASEFGFQVAYDGLEVEF